MKTKPLSKYQQAEYLRLYKKGYSAPDICEKMNINRSSHIMTAAVDKQFARAIKIVDQGRKYQVESTLYRYAIGKCKIVKETWLAKMDMQGLPELDQDGKQVFWCQKKEITNVPAHPALLKFFLETKFADSYGGKDGKHVLTPEEIGQKLEAAARFITDEPVKLVT